MAAIDDLLTCALAKSSDVLTREVLVGLYWTAVYGQRVGLAATLADATCCDAIDAAGVGQLHYRPIHELINLLRSTHPLEVSIGMAALNSALPVNEQDGVEFNARDLILERGRDKNVVTVGHFPFTDAIRNVAAQLWVLELNPSEGDQPASAAPELIPQADVIGLTATTLMNGTFESLRLLFPSQALVVMMGPSTPLHKVLFDYGVDILAGALVDDPSTLLHYVGQGSSLHRVPGLRRFTMVK
ncbi:MAG: DUF364 domain-containing protein [Chloroflexi bacterium]|nr:DUF364 domain-containing protein [Chloroflexota bacterium]